MKFSVQLIKRYNGERITVEDQDLLPLLVEAFQNLGFVSATIHPADAIPGSQGKINWSERRKTSDNSN